MFFKDYFFKKVNVINKVKEIFNKFNEIVLIKNFSDDSLWINSFAEDFFNVDFLKFEDVFNMYCKSHSIKGIINELDITDTIENVIFEINDNNTIFFLEKIVHDEMFIIRFKNVTNLFEKDELIKKAKYYDELTKIYNRKYLFDNFKNDIFPKTVLFFDIKDFKSVNDIYGHHIGDEVLKIIASRIKNELKETDILVRYGGDEFIVVLENIKDEEIIESIIKRIAESVFEKIAFENVILNIKTNIGYAKYPEDSRSISKLIRYADIAMYQSKKNDDIVQKFDRKLYNNIIEENKIRRNLESMIKNNEIIINYQDIDTLKDNSRSATEVYLKIKGNETQEYLEIANKSNLIVEIDKMVALKVIENLNENQGTVFMNISLKSIFSDDYYNYIKNLIEKFNVNPLNLGFDISEKILIYNKKTMMRISKLKDLGVFIAIDDYGTGNLSLKQIDKLQFDIVKIDKSVTEKICFNDINRKLARSIIGSSKIFEKSVIAEGIEDKETFDFFKTLGCTYGQGYFISRPDELNNKEKILEIII